MSPRAQLANELERLDLLSWPVLNGNFCLFKTSHIFPWRPPAAVALTATRFVAPRVQTEDIGTYEH
jgi:hypothetical protein